MTKIVYVCYSRDEEEEIQKVRRNVEVLQDFLEGVSFVMSDVPNIDSIEESSVILCVLTPSFAASNDVNEELTYSSNLNKTIVGLFASSGYGLNEIFGKFGHRELKNSIRSGFFNMFSIEEQERFVKQMIAYLGLDNPLADAVGAKVSVTVKSSYPFKYHIDRYKGMFDKGTILNFRLKPGYHTFSIDSLENDYCSFRESFEISNISEYVVRSFDLGALIEEIGHDGTIVDEQGNRYTGWLVKGQFDGAGVYETYDGYVYNGVFSKGKILSGTLTEPSGNQYSGQFRDWKRHGEGKQIWKDTGEMYEGSWEYDHMSGHGMFVASDSSIYEGEFRNDILCLGVVTNRNGKKVQVSNRNLKIENADVFPVSNISQAKEEYITELLDYSTVYQPIRVSGSSHVDDKEQPLVSEAIDSTKQCRHSLSAVCNDTDNHRIFFIDGFFYKEEFGTTLYVGEGRCKWEDEGIILVCRISNGVITSGTFFMDDKTPIVGGVFKNDIFIPEEKHFPLWREFLQSVLEDLDISMDEGDSSEHSSEEVSIVEPFEAVEVKEIEEDVTQSQSGQPIEKNTVVREKPSPVYFLNSIAYPDGSRYVGNFKDKKRQGKGSLFLYNGDSYVGCWNEDKFYGEGEYKWASEEIVFKGTFEHGLPVQGCYFMAGDMPIVSGRWVGNEYIPTEEFFPNWAEFIQDLRFEELD